MTETTSLWLNAFIKSFLARQYKDFDAFLRTLIVPATTDTESLFA